MPQEKQSNDASESELGEEDPVESDEESDVDKISVAPEVPLVTKSTDSVVLEELSFEDVTVNSWILVLYEGDKFLGRCLSKINGKFWVQCLLIPYGIWSAQIFEKEVDVVYYDKVYKPPIIPWATELDDEGKHTRKTFYKY